MLKFGIQNLRRLAYVPLMPIKPITILVGRNSSGKSTYLRSLPLLRQSVMTRTSTPILWWGGDVDFGSFDKSVSQNNTNLNIEFSFGIDSITIGPMHFYSSMRVYAPMQEREIKDIEITLVVSHYGRGTRISEVHAKFGTPATSVSVKIDQNNAIKSITVDDNEALNLMGSAGISVTPGDIFPHYSVSYAESESSQGRSGRAGLLWEGLKLLAPDRAEPFDLDSALLLLSFIGRREGPDKNFRNYAKRFGDLWGIVEKFYQIASPEQIRYIEYVAMVHSVIPILNAISDYLTEVARNLLYIGPARARSERYYRYQDLAVSEIDSDGKNLPMFLNSLPEYQKDNLSNWIRQLYGFGIEVSNEAGHISINMLDGSNKINVTDTGYGVSQVLPVLAQIWWARTRYSESELPFLLAIEQPELHLHPAHQALIADALIQGRSRQGGGVQYQGREVYCIVETHSEALVNRLGQLIEENRVGSDDVQVLIFSEHEDDRGIAKVSVSDFSPQGFLNNWPYGFFQP